MLRGAVLNVEELDGIHSPEETDLPVLLGECPHAEQVAGVWRLVEVVVGPPGALGPRVLGHERPVDGEHGELFESLQWRNNLVCSPARLRAYHFLFSSVHPAQQTAF